MTDAIVEQAAAAAATPANGAPAPVAPAPAPKPTPPPAPTTTPANPEARRQEIMKEADYWKDGPKTAALRAEMRAIVDSNPDVPAPARPKPAEPPVGPTTLELRQREIIVKLSDRNTPEEEKQKLRIEQRALIASQDTPEEKAARA